MPPLAALIIAIVKPILVREGYRIKEELEEQVTDEELYQLEPVLNKLGLTSYQISGLDEKEVSEIVKAHLDQLDLIRQAEIMRDLRDILDQDEYFEIRSC